MDYSVNDFGEAHFYIEKKGIKRGITAFGTITMIDKKYVWFTDNEGYPYLIAKKDFEFKKCEFENKLK